MTNLLEALLITLARSPHRRLSCFLAGCLLWLILIPYLCLIPFIKLPPETTEGASPNQ